MDIEFEIAKCIHCSNLRETEMKETLTKQTTDQRLAPNQRASPATIKMEPTFVCQAIAYPNTLQATIELPIGYRNTRGETPARMQVNPCQEYK